MKRTILSLAALLAATTALSSCSRFRREPEPPRAVVTETAPTAETPEVSPDPSSTATADAAPAVLRLRDPDMLSDLPDERQFEAAVPGSAASRDGAVIASPPVPEKTAGAGQ